MSPSLLVSNVNDLVNECRYLDRFDLCVQLTEMKLI